MRSIFICVRPAEDDQKEKSLSHHTIQQLIVEKDQALADLNSVEKSLADLFRRYEKMKDVLDGFRKVTRRLPASVCTSLEWSAQRCERDREIVDLVIMWCFLVSLR